MAEVQREPRLLEFIVALVAPKTAAVVERPAAPPKVCCIRRNTRGRLRPGPDLQLEFRDAQRLAGFVAAAEPGPAGEISIAWNHEVGQLWYRDGVMSQAPPAARHKAQLRGDP